MLKEKERKSPKGSFQSVSWFFQSSNLFEFRCSCQCIMSDENTKEQTKQTVRICATKKENGIKNVTHRVDIPLNASLQDMIALINKEFSIKNGEKYSLYYIDEEVKYLFVLYYTLNTIHVC